MQRTIQTLTHAAPFVAFLDRTLRRLAERVGRACRDWQRQREIRARYRVLNSLDERTLGDLGIHRSEILWIATNPDDRDRAN